MTKIYEALQRAAFEGKTELQNQLILPKPQSNMLHISSPVMQQKMISLYRSIQSLLPTAEEGIIVHFLELYNQQEASVLTREFAKTIAVKLGKRVLLLDATPTAAQLINFNIFPKYSWREAFRDNKSIKAVIYQVEDTSLFVSQISREINAITEVVESPRTDQYLQDLKKAFPLILINSSAGTSSSDSIALATKSDGVVIVVESEKTRWRVAKKLKDDIEHQGGYVMGTVLSRRQYHIPDFIYDRI